MENELFIGTNVTLKTKQHYKFDEALVAGVLKTRVI